MKTSDYFLTIQIFAGLLAVSSFFLLTLSYKLMKERKVMHDIIVSMTTDLENGNKNLEQILRALKKDQDLLNEKIINTLQ